MAERARDERDQSASREEHIARVVAETAPGGDGVRWWQRVDAALRTLAAEQSKRDYSICLLLVEAEKSRVFVPLGMTSVYEYARTLFGWERRQVADRLRLGKALATLPAMTAEFAAGRRPWTAMRALARVAVPENEGDWLQATEGWSVSKIEQRVAGLLRGAGPEDPSDPELVTHRLALTLSAATMALYKDVVDMIRRELGPQATEDDVLRILCERTLGGPKDEGRAPYQVALTVCEQCERTWQQGGGESYELDPDAAECARCDAQHIGRVDSQPDERTHVGHPTPPASQDIPPAIRRKVVRRDRGRCQVPNCRNSAWVHVHHAELRSEGGTHDPDKLVCLCSAHHQALHSGFIAIEILGAGRFAFTHADGTLYGRAPAPDKVQSSLEAFQALRHLGFKEGESRRLVEAAQSQVGPDAPLEELITAALRLSRRPAVARGIGPS